MIFCNGDCHITYQSEEALDEAVRTQAVRSFEDRGHAYLTKVSTTENTITFQYSPVVIMEAENTIEPGHKAMIEAEKFLERMEISI
ncbi:hypothetical protein [Salinicoccus sp. CNSTN-B1]